MQEIVRKNGAKCRKLKMGRSDLSQLEYKINRPKSKTNRPKNSPSCDQHVTQPSFPPRCVVRVTPVSPSHFSLSSRSPSQNQTPAKSRSPKPRKPLLHPHLSFLSLRSLSLSSTHQGTALSQLSNHSHQAPAHHLHPPTTQDVKSRVEKEESSGINSSHRCH